MHTQGSKDLSFPHSTCRIIQVVLGQPWSWVALAFLLSSLKRHLVASCVAPTSQCLPSSWQKVGKSWPPAIHFDSDSDHHFGELDTLQTFQKELAKFQGRKLAILAELTLTHIKVLWCGRRGEYTKRYKATKAYKNNLQGYVPNLSQTLSTIFLSIITLKRGSVYTTTAKQVKLYLHVYVSTCVIHIFHFYVSIKYIIRIIYIMYITITCIIYINMFVTITYYIYKYI